MSELREEVDALGRVVDEQEQTIATLRDELDRREAALGWRLQSRLEPFGNRMRDVPVVGQIYRTVHRALELWVDDGFAGVFRQAGVKLGLLLRGNRCLVDSARREVGERPAGLLAIRALRMLQQERERRERAAVDDRLRLRVVARSNVTDDADRRRLSG
jgi:hypothetical protein